MDEDDSNRWSRLIWVMLALVVLLLITLWAASWMTLDAASTVLPAGD